MVSASGVDLVGPVDLFQKHHPQQVVGKGHGGHGQPQSGLPLQGFVHSEGAADEKDDVAGALGGAVRQIAGQLLAGALPPLHTHGDHQTAVGQLGPDSVGLLGEGRLDLGGGGILRQPFLRQLDDL